VGVHMSAGKEWVLFDEGQVMPCYVISFHKQ
jgi:hypothetical protein